MKGVWLLKAFYFHCRAFNSGKSPHSEFLASHYLNSNWGRLAVVATTTKSGGWGNYFKQLLNLPESLTSSETSARARHCILQDCSDNAQYKLKSQNVLVSFWDYLVNVPLLDSQLLFSCVLLRQCQYLNCTVLNGRTHGWIRKKTILAYYGYYRDIFLKGRTKPTKYVRRVRRCPVQDSYSLPLNYESRRLPLSKPAR